MPTSPSECLVQVLALLLVQLPWQAKCYDASKLESLSLTEGTRTEAPAQPVPGCFQVRCDDYHAHFLDKEKVM